MIQTVRDFAGQRLRTDVCIVGAGPAGITLVALALRLGDHLAEQL